MRRFEFDPSWLVIRCLAAVALVEIVGALGGAGVVSGAGDWPR